jgi:peptide/nickel transport system ATP-binding protein
MAMTDSPLVEVRDLTVDYVGDSGIARAVNGISFDLKPGEAFGLAGESGCGKSTVAFALARLTRLPGLVSGGSIRFAGEDVLALNGERLRRFRWSEVSFVFQSAMSALNPVTRISEQIDDAITAHRPNASTAERRARAAELLDMVGISPKRLDDYPHQFSGGMRQRICIAMALALEPKLIIMDEPTTALDVVVQRDIIEQICELKNRFGFSILFITHDLGLMIEFCDRIGVMYAGELVEVAPASAILTSPQHPYTRALGRSFPALTGDRVRLEGIAGAPPSLMALPEGCRFNPRCGEAIPVCTRLAPALRPTPQTGGEAACHLLQ